LKVFRKDNDTRALMKSLQKLREHWHRYPSAVPKALRTLVEMC
jgi:hypothetical protein